MIGYVVGGVSGSGSLGHRATASPSGRKGAASAPAATTARRERPIGHPTMSDRWATPSPQGAWIPLGDSGSGSRSW
jgi:hypothetical protein